MPRFCIIGYGKEFYVIPDDHNWNESPDIALFLSFLDMLGRVFNDPFDTNVLSRMDHVDASSFSLVIVVWKIKKPFAGY